MEGIVPAFPLHSRVCKLEGFCSIDSVDLLSSRAQLLNIAAVLTNLELV